MVGGGSIHAHLREGGFSSSAYINDIVEVERQEGVMHSHTVTVMRGSRFCGGQAE